MVVKSVLIGVTLGFFSARFEASVATFNAEITPSCFVGCWNLKLQILSFKVQATRGAAIMPERYVYICKPVQQGRLRDVIQEA